MAARRRHKRRNLPPGRARAAVLVVCTAALLVAKLALSAERPLEAAAIVSIAAEPAPAASESDAPALPDSLLRAARVHADEKRFDAAATDLRRALVARPGDRTIGSLLARVLAWDRRFDESIAAYRVLLAAHPDDAFDRAGYARALAWSGRHEESIREFRRAAAADPTNLETRIGLARALSWSGDLPGAAMEYARIRRSNPAYGEAWLGAATVARWRGAATAADRFAARAAALGADPANLDEERVAVDRALAPTVTGGWTTSRETQRASGAPDFTIEETGPFGVARATLGRAAGLGVRVARTQLFETNSRPAPGDTTLNYDLSSRSLRADASFLRGYPVQASAGGEWRSFDARAAKVLYPLSGDDEFAGWNARLWAYAGRFTPSFAARRTFVALKGSHPSTGTLRFEPGDLTDLEGSLAWQWNARGTASLFASRGDYSDDNRRERAGGTVAYRVRTGRPALRLDYALVVADWTFRSPSYFTPLASTRHAGGATLSGYSDRGAVDWGVRWEFSHLASSNFEEITANAFSGWLNGTIADRFPVGAEASWSTDDNDYKTWYAALYGAVRW